EGVRHLAEHEPERERRSREDRRAAKHTSERLRELGVRHRIRSDSVDRASKLLVRDRVLDHSGDVVDRDPAHALASASDLAADTEPKRQQHPRQGAPAPAEDESGPEVDDAGRPGLEGSGRRLPFLADLGKETLARWARLGEELVAAVAVVADRRAADE